MSTDTIYMNYELRKSSVRRDESNNLRFLYYYYFVICRKVLFFGTNPHIGLRLVQPTGQSRKMALTNVQKILFRAPQSARHITGMALQATLGPKPKKPAPFPYKEKDYTFFNSMFDKTTSRFDENSKLIVLEGPVGIGNLVLLFCLCNTRTLDH